MQEKLQLYLDYVQHYSFFGDIGLIFKTFWVIVKER
ncbi:MAG: sugar transferase [Bacteroidales bacterium]|nr:sugar transferase [Bacteroidales bacterium]